AFRFLSDTGVVLAGARVDGERGPDPEPLVKLEEAPGAHSHAVFVPAPVRHVRKQRHARGRRKDLARHRPPDVPHLVVDDGPEREPRIAGQFERRPVDDCRKIAAFPGQHGGRHGLGAPLGSRAMIRRRRHHDPPREPARPAVRHLRGEDASPSGYAASNAAPHEAEKGMDLRSGQPLAAGRDRASRWRDEPAQAPLEDRAKPWLAGAGRAAPSAARVPRAVTVAIFLLVFLLPAWPWLSGEVTIPW